MAATPHWKKRTSYKSRLPGFQPVRLSFAAPDKKLNNMEQQAFLQASFTPVFLLTPAPIINKIPYLQGPIAFEARDFFLMLFCSSIGRWGMLCLPSTSNSFWCLPNFNWINMFGSIHKFVSAVGTVGLNCCKFELELLHLKSHVN